jgi:hypothetical protein
MQAYGNSCGNRLMNMRIFIAIFFIALATACTPGHHSHLVIINNYLYKFPAQYRIHRMSWLKGIANTYELDCNSYVKINPLSADTSENNRLPRFAMSFFAPSRSEINAAGVLIRDQLPLIAPDSGNRILEEIRLSDQYYMGYVNKRGNKKILAFFDCILRYDGPVPPSVLDYLVPLSINLTTKKIFLVRDNSGSGSYLADD